MTKPRPPLGDPHRYFCDACKETFLLRMQIGERVRFCIRCGSTKVRLFDQAGSA